jgi:hypothetical protein
MNKSCAGTAALLAYLSQNVSRQSSLLKEFNSDISGDGNSIWIGLVEEVLVDSLLLGGKVEIRVSWAIWSAQSIQAPSACFVTARKDCSPEPAMPRFSAMFARSLFRDWCQTRGGLDQCLPMQRAQVRW